MPEFARADRERVRAACHEAMDRHQLPGLAVGVVEGDALVYGEAFGFADIKGRRDLTISHRQRIGSVTKTMTAFCVLQLVEEGVVGLDAAVPTLLPELRFIGDGDPGRLTLARLLSHTGGIGEAPTRGDLAQPESTLWSGSPDLLPPAERYPDGVELEVDPGTKWAYANHGFGLLGDILALLEEKPLVDVFRERIFRRLDMRDSDIRDRPHHTLAAGYHRALDASARAARGNVELWALDAPPEDDVNVRGGYVYLPIPAAGAVQSPVRDMARYASMVLARGRGLVEPSTFEEMTRPQWEPDPRLVSVGLGFWRQRRFGEFCLGHGGSVVGGWNTQFAVFPERNQAVVIHFNLEADVTAAAQSRIVQAVLDATPIVPRRNAADPAIRAGAPGWYEAPPGDLTNTRVRWNFGRIAVTAEGDGLVLRTRRGKHTDGVRLCPVGADDPGDFLLDDGELEPARVIFTRDADGAVDGLLMDPCVRMRRVDPLPA